MRIVGSLLAIVGVLAFAAEAADQPISASKIQLKRTKSGSSMSFITKDANMPFPAVLSLDNPATGSPGGVLIELYTRTEGWAQIEIPPGLGKPGWSVATGTIPSYKFANAPAPGGLSMAKSLVMRQGKLLKITTKAVPLPLAEAEGFVAIRITMGTKRSCAMFRSQAVSRDVPGKFIGKFASPLFLPDCEDATIENPPNQCGGADTFQVIQDRIFTVHGCDVATCHGSLNSAHLDLRPGASYTQLVNVAADNPVAAAAGKDRVTPGDSVASFLSQKLHGTMDSGAGEGSQMPLVGGPLSAQEIALIDGWIDAGAPQAGEVEGAPCLPPITYSPAPALTPPAGGYQLLLNGPVLQPGQEQEGCMWVPVPNAADFDVGKWEYSLNPGTHHFAIFEWSGNGTPTTNVWTPGDFGCFSGANFGNNISGTPQAPYYIDAYPSGVARRLVAGRYLGLNAHYYNTFTVPIQIKVWINMYPYSGPTPRLATTIVDIDDTFGINIPPFTAQVFPPAGQPRARWTNTTGGPVNVIMLGGHMHYRGVRFTVWNSIGTKLYESFNWAHPNTRLFSPPLVLAAGDYFDYECFYDNGIDRPVRTNAQGNPVYLNFGVSAEDAMCIVTGSYYQ
jgi:hypothetical protein